MNSQTRTVGRWVINKNGLSHRHFLDVHYPYWLDRKSLASGDCYFHLSRKQFLTPHDRKTLPQALKIALDLFGLKPGTARFVPAGTDDRSILSKHFPQDGRAAR